MSVPLHIIIDSACCALARAASRIAKCRVMSCVERQRNKRGHLLYKLLN